MKRLRRLWPLLTAAALCLLAAALFLALWMDTADRPSRIRDDRSAAARDFATAESPGPSAKEGEVPPSGPTPPVVEFLPIRWVREPRPSSLDGAEEAVPFEEERNLIVRSHSANNPSQDVDRIEARIGPAAWRVYVVDGQAEPRLLYSTGRDLSALSWQAARQVQVFYQTRRRLEQGAAERIVVIGRLLIDTKRGSMTDEPLLTKPVTKPAKLIPSFPDPDARVRVYREPAGSKVLIADDEFANEPIVVAAGGELMRLEGVPAEISKITPDWAPMGGALLWSFSKFIFAPLADANARAVGSVNLDGWTGDASKAKVRQYVRSGEYLYWLVDFKSNSVVPTSASRVFISPRGLYEAIITRRQGSDCFEVAVRTISTKETRPIPVDGCGARVSWFTDRLLLVDMSGCCSAGVAHNILLVDAQRWQVRSLTVGEKLLFAKAVVSPKSNRVLVQSDRTLQVYTYEGSLIRDFGPPPGGFEFYDATWSRDAKSIAYLLGPAGWRYP